MVRFLLPLPAPIPPKSIQGKLKVTFMACSRKRKRKILQNRKKMVRRRQINLCAKCFTYDPKLEVHHVIFKSLGGTDQATNLEGLCHKCHQIIHNPTTEALQLIGYVPCEMDGECDFCKKIVLARDLFWFSTSYEYVEGDYYCRRCAMVKYQRALAIGLKQVEEYEKEIC